MNKTNLVIGYGDVGQTIFDLEVKTNFACYVFDIKFGKKANLSELEKKKFHIMHICFPYGPHFVDEVIEYCYKYKPKYVIIHSSVKPGTTDEIQSKAHPFFFYSPIRGQHDVLGECVGQHFVKYIGQSFVKERKAKREISLYMNELGIKWMWGQTAKALELMKVLSTTYFGWCILFAKETKKLCDKYDVPYEFVYIHANKTYNQGYKELGRPYYTRPVLCPPAGKIGGHCVSENIELLPECKLKRFFKELNEEK